MPLVLGDVVVDGDRRPLLPDTAAPSRASRVLPREICIYIYIYVLHLHICICSFVPGAWLARAW